MNKRLDKAKSDFGTEEHGVNGTVPVESDVAKTKDSVSAILKARKEAKNSKWCCSFMT